MMSRVTYCFPINLIWDALKSHFWWKRRKKVSKGDGDLMVAYVVDIASGKECVSYSDSKIHASRVAEPRSSLMSCLHGGLPLCLNKHATPTWQALCGCG